MFDFLSNIYFNYLSIGSAIATLICLLGGLFLVLIKNRSESTLALGLSFLFFGLFSSSYIVAQALYQPIAAYHSWVIMASILPAFTFIARFALKFPTDITPKFTRYLFITQVTIAVLVFCSFVFLTKDAKIIFRFTSHHYDLDIDDIRFYFGLIIMTYALLAIAINIWKAYKTQEKDRWVLIKIAILFMTCTVVPLITNMLSSSGEIERGTHQSTVVLIVAFGFFSMFIFYTNATKDRTTFMAKIIGLSLITFLLITQLISYLALSVQEEGYDNIKREHAQRVIQTKTFKEAKDVEYVAALYKENWDQSVKLLKEPKAALDFENQQPEFYNTAVLVDIESLPTEGFRDSFSAYLESTENYFIAYKQSLQHFLDKNKKKGKNLKQAVLDFTADVEHSNRIRRYKIESFDNKGFGKRTLRYLASYNENSDFYFFKKVLEDEINSDTNEGVFLKNELLKYIAAIRPVGTRIYRHSEDNKDHFVSHVYYDKDEKVFYEVGFKYRTYRAFIHPQGRNVMIALIAIVLTALFVFPLFFKGSLVEPLNDLVDGVKLVNKGDLTHKIPIRVHDEIGFLADNFNSMIASIKQAQDELQDYAENLEEKVAERTHELQQTLAEVQALKKQQDGDYFLTTLLIKPLGVNSNQSEKINVDFLVEQKKKFEFRKWSSEIGGDINIAHNITLKGKSHVVFLNADAMGKSIQGAGGALVLGAVFQSIIERTKLSSNSQNQFPERWLKNAFQELHNIFVSFEGSMLISLVLGMIDEETGLFYYINAEHPWTILYRDNQAKFIENELLFRKLGTQGVSMDIFIKTLQLQENDVIILGSDGRDDLLLELTKKGRVINEDENQILRLVEKSNSNLEKLHAEILKNGQLTDDLSLLRVGYLENHIAEPLSRKQQIAIEDSKVALKENKVDDAIYALKAVHDENHPHEEIIKLLAKSFYLKKNYGEAAIYAELVPSNSEYIFIASKSNKFLKNYSLAIDFAEKLRLREPKLIKNLLNLVDLYALIENYSRANSILKSVLELDPKNESALEIEKAIIAKLAQQT